MIEKLKRFLVNEIDDRTLSHLLMSFPCGAARFATHSNRLFDFLLFALFRQFLCRDLKVNSNLSKTHNILGRRRTIFLIKQFERQFTVSVKSSRNQLIKYLLLSQEGQGLVDLVTNRFVFAVVLKLKKMRDETNLSNLFLY